ncbi:LytTR family transcriptional regulator DNA-binding domain-containing protein [Limosilactobacillus sp. RRLNB_1_1]|uniref:LytTR family transcriptional regulator DNA-binding domain-containing protein n=1 Tax=Limosilactobacillus albertensis TaxID=2759752 RepID=A0A7W3TQJ6_9LACO|nr:LytTR family DNA-binding domain-containing protein [Limosilactobacillus albertensis]MBB1069067.1 LytTR family transcriptional regulator DNA-binding domain-containing protein [Limosilactobacillus albertensis]MCD7118827.1 LytTR family transcriptional regulator DNA-binding domain-containing protein [Limosilactobacillus albertensis]MCD7128024.1 LytTR family transcriptional regulator DNA-binding domain-containing protein [Limosilactobacillus albertensis]
MDFIVKKHDNVLTELRKDIHHISGQIQSNETELPFVYKDYSNTIKVAFKNINYFESNSGNSHSSILNTVNKQKRQLNYNLRDIEKMDNRFFRAHRSYLVNLRQIDYVDPRKRIVYFHNGEECSVSKLHIRHLLKLVNTI